jgi:hypothetical protein
LKTSTSPVGALSPYEYVSYTPLSHISVEHAKVYAKSAQLLLHNLLRYATTVSPDNSNGDNSHTGDNMSNNTEVPSVPNFSEAATLKAPANLNNDYSQTKGQSKMLNNLNKNIVKAAAQIQDDIEENSACSTLEQECAFMIAGGKDKIYLNELASKLTGTILQKLTDNIVDEETIEVFAEGAKRKHSQSLNASIYMVAAYSVLMNGYSSKDIIQTALINWADSDGISTEQNLNFADIAENIITQFIKDEVLVLEESTGQMPTGERFLGHAATSDILDLRLTTLAKLWEQATPKMKPMLHKITWNIKGQCELKNLNFNVDVKQAFIDTLNKVGHVAYKINPAIRAEIKRNLKRSVYNSDQVLEMRAMLQLDPTKEYFFPHTPDYRGRFYARGGLTTFQGVKDIRAAFDFSESVKADEYGLFLHIANAHGMDKVSITDRIQWVRNSHTQLMTVKSQTLYAERARLAYIEYKETGLSNIVCRIDGTCSGVQITSGIYLDKKTGAAVNVAASSPDDAPQDCYGLVANKALKLCKKGIDKAIIEKYGRNITKPVVMLLAYGAGEAGLTQTVSDFLKDNNERTGNKLSLTRIIMEAIEIDFPAIKGLNVELQEELRDLPRKKLTYFLEDITVNIRPRNSEHLNLKGSNYTAKLIGKTLPDSAALARGIAPNFVHSIDSLILRKAVNNIDGDVSCIHDDIGIQSNKVREALQEVRTAFVNVIKAEPLRALYNGLGIGDEYEPQDNGLKLNDVLESTYLFS